MDTNTVNINTHSSHRIRSLFAALALAFVIALVSAPAVPVAAQDEDEVSHGTVLFDDTAGEYGLRIRQLPESPIVGTLQVIVEPVNASTGEPVTDALVRVFATPSEEGERQYSPALNFPSDRSIYFAQLELEHPGTWTIDVEIDGPLGREIAITETSIRSRSRSGDNIILGTALFTLVTVAFAGGGLWVWYSSKKARARRDAAHRMGHGPTGAG